MSQAHPPGSSGKITSGIQINALALRTIDYVFEELQQWRDDPKRSCEVAENRLNSQLCKFLDSRAREVFPMVRFDHQEYQAGHRSVDISASPAVSGIIDEHTIYNPILLLEGKRLPAPKVNREKEYVTGGTDKTGAIQRFKIGVHGARFDLAAVIGYLQDGSAQHWHDKINSWIFQLSRGTIEDISNWTESETLQSLEEDHTRGVARCNSLHPREGLTRGDEIAIQHLWVRMKWTLAKTRRNQDIARSSPAVETFERGIGKKRIKKKMEMKM